MSTLTRSIAGLFAINLALLTLILSGFVVAVDVFMNLDRYSRAAQEIAQAASPDGAEPGAFGTIVYSLLVIGDLWGPRLLQLLNSMIGLLLIGAAGFTCSQMVRRREFLAMLAVGISLRRCAMPFFFIAALALVVQAVSQEMLLPKVAHLIGRDPEDAWKSDSGVRALHLTPDGQGLLYQAQRFDVTTSALDGLVVWREDAGARIDATRAVWTGDRWRLEDGWRTDFTADPPTRERVVEIVTPLDPDRLRVRYLRGFGNALSWASISEIREALPADDRTAIALHRARWGRIAAIMVNALAFVSALALLMRRVPGPMIGPVLRTLPLAGAGLGGAMAAQLVAWPGLPVEVGAFVPVALFVPIAVGLFAGIRT